MLKSTNGGPTFNAVTRSLTSDVTSMVTDPCGIILRAKLFKHLQSGPILDANTEVKIL